MKCAWLLFAVWAVHAQTHEIGVLGGAGFLPKEPVEGAPAPVNAGFQDGLVAGASFAQDLYAHWGGEIRYLFEQGNLSLTSGGAAASFGGHAHVLHYDLIYYPQSRGERIRPYLAVGGGMKLFEGVGTEEAYQPLMQYAYLTRTHQLKPMLTVGAGMKIALHRRMWLRVDFRDQITGFPTKLITPAPGLAIHGWLHDFVPACGIDWSF